MKQFNYDLLKEKIGTQYNDMKGIAAIDGHHYDYLWRMCEDFGIELQNWFLVGIELSDWETIGQLPLTVTAYLVEKLPNEDQYEQVAQRLEAQPKVEIHKKSFNISYQDLGKYIKRLNIGVLGEIANHIKDAEFIDD
jgi:hypothetical protein